MTKFKHIIVTRFYMRYGKHLPGHAWFDERLKILARYTAPSLHAQTMQDFSWLLLVDETTAPEWVAELESKSKATVLLVKGGSGGAAKAVTQYVKKTINADWVLTTRLDSDDLLHKEFVHDLHQGIRPEDKVVWFQHGIATDMNSVRKVASRSNQFSSILERNDSSFASVYQLPHKQLARRLKHRVLPILDPRWLICVHKLRIGAKPGTEWQGLKPTAAMLQTIKQGFPPCIWRSLMKGLGA